MISNIIQKEFSSINDKMNMLWTQPESMFFTDFIRASVGANIIDFDKTYYGNYDVSIVVCNNRLLYMEKCVELAKFFHVPLLIIDHSVKSGLVSNDFMINIPFKPFYQIATSKDIYMSWGKIHNVVLDTSSPDKWKNIIFQLIKTTFIINEDEAYDVKE